MQLEQHMALESGIPIPIAQHNSHDDSFPRSAVIHLTWLLFWLSLSWFFPNSSSCSLQKNHNIEDDKEIEDEPSPICSQVTSDVYNEHF